MQCCLQSRPRLPYGTRQLPFNCEIVRLVCELISNLADLRTIGVFHLWAEIGLFLNVQVSIEPLAGFVNGHRHRSHSSVRRWKRDGMGHNNATVEYNTILGNSISGQVQLVRNLREHWDLPCAPHLAGPVLEPVVLLALSLRAVVRHDLATTSESRSQ
jgi:hypothetical protein